MKKSIASVVLAAAIALPALPAAAAESDAWWGRKPCPWGEVGTIIWHDTPFTDYEEIRLCVPRIGPGGEAATDSARAGVSRCTGGGYEGVYVWWYDLDNRYHERRFCIYTGP
ncbi:MAG: hypothetical protein M3279_08345 [Actinomycetota bacterium]|nr:hypothetical protein [Actinomycetota bacterium]